MIPRLKSHLSAAAVPAGFFERLVETGFAGDAEAGPGSRTVFSTDNSIYQVEPSAVLFPRGTDDLKVIARILSEPAFISIAVAPRGGGTGTNGQSLTSGIIIDCSRHMTSVLEIDPVRRTARVQAGVVKDQLNRALRPYGLFFAPELSTSNRATIGGMIATDACGQGSCLYGKTSNHVLGLRTVLMDGTDWWSRPVDEAQLAEIIARGDRIGEIHRTVANIAETQGDRIEAIFPDLNRYMTGYDLAHIRRPDGRFDLNAILCGAEGTLAFIAEAELNLLPLPGHAALINIRYSDFNAALEDARNLIGLKVASVETVDEMVLGLAKGDLVWNRIGHFFPDEGPGATDGINIVEVLADDEAELERKIGEVTSALDSKGNASRFGHSIARGHADVEAIWSMRKRAVGLLGNVEGPVRPVPFVEDTAVPPENLAAYIREFRALLDQAGVSYGMFGHVDAGVLHVRPALDLSRQDHVPLVRSISDAVVALTKKHGGVLWGEHGKGIRSEYVPEYFGDLYPYLQEIKRAFDPANRLNPGKIAAPSADGLLKIDKVPLRGAIDRIIGNGLRADFDNAAYCNGNGACFDFDESSPMCPSFKATKDRRFSPKGRAALIREWLRLLVDQGIDPRQEAKSARRRVAVFDLPIRVLNAFDPRNRSDFSHEVKEAMDTCLACKACAGQCPVKVNVPAFRSKFLELYHGRYPRPLKHQLVAATETLLPLAAYARPVFNAVSGTAIGRYLMRMVGLTALPVLPRQSLSREAGRLGVRVATVESVRGSVYTQPGNPVLVFVVDAFTQFFEPRVPIAAIRLAQRMGYTVFLARTQQTGKALHVHGYLGQFASVAKRSARHLHELANAGATLVGIDPSMTLVYRSEYKEALDGEIAPVVLLPQEWLASGLDRLSRLVDLPRNEVFRLLPHCTERSNVPASAGQWRSVFAAVGAKLDVLDVGCCGMAGTFGHEVENRATSERLYAMSWAEKVSRAAKDGSVAATSYSCRSQIRMMDKQAIVHPIEILERITVSPQT